MPESRHEQVVQALQAWLQGITADGGASYWLSPERVIRAPTFHAGCVDPTLETIYILSPEDVVDEWRDFCTWRSTLPVNLTAITKFDAVADPFAQPTPGRWTLQTRLEHDAKRRILGSPAFVESLGFTVQADIPLTVYSPETYWDGWAGVFLRLLFRFPWERSTGP